MSDTDYRLMGLEPNCKRSQNTAQRFQNEQAAGNADDDNNREAANCANILEPPDPNERGQQHQPGQITEQFQG